MPRLFQAADATSTKAQGRYINGTRARLLFIVLAAAMGISGWRVGGGDVDVLGLIGVLLFVLALLTEVVLWQGRPDKAWYDGRAVAESAKTLGWKFAVCADPFPRALDEAAAQRALIERMDTLRNHYPDLELAPSTEPMISDWMIAQRTTTLQQRRQTYLENRLRDQLRWYSDKQRYNRRRATQWRWALVGLEALGAALSIVGAVTRFGVLLTPTIAALAGAVIAWSATKQHDQLARAYAAAVDDLTSAETKLNLSMSEEAWAGEVNDAEDAISREHTLWLASRSKR